MAKSQLSDDEREGRELGGSWVDDPLLSAIHGYDLRRNLTEQANYLSGEVDEIKDRLFPYHLENQNAPEFVIEYDKDNRIKQVLNEHLVEDRVFSRSINSSRLYPTLGLKGQFDEMAALLLTDGKVFFAIDWSRLPEEYAGLEVPVRLRYIRTSTMRVETQPGGRKRYVQQYNPIVAPHEHPGLRGRKFVFERENILHLEYPFETPPVKQASPLAIESWNVFQQVTRQTEAMARPEDMRFDIERARHQSNKKLWRKYHLLRGKIRQLFSLPAYKYFEPYSDNELALTDYYKAYRLVKHLKYLMRFRSFLLDSFNAQILQPIAQRNQLPVCPKLMYKGNHANDSAITDRFEAFKNGDISYSELVESLVI